MLIKLITLATKPCYNHFDFCDIGLGQQNLPHIMTAVLVHAFVVLLHEGSLHANLIIICTTKSPTKRVATITLAYVTNI